MTSTDRLFYTMLECRNAQSPRVDQQVDEMTSIGIDTRDL